MSNMSDAFIEKKKTGFVTPPSEQQKTIAQKGNLAINRDREYILKLCEKARKAQIQKKTQKRAHTPILNQFTDEYIYKWA